jgi:hypothetical protein
MINNGNKGGLTQSSTFNGYANQNAFYPQPQYQQYVFVQGQYQSGGQQYVMQPQDKPVSSNAYYASNGHRTEAICGGNQSMRTSQDQYNNQANIQTKDYHNTPQMQGTQNIFLQSKPASQSATYGTATSISTNISTTAWYNPKEPPKQSIEYKKKITRLLD